MYESIRSLRWSWIALGWFLAVALTSLILLALISFGLIAEGSPSEGLWIAVSLLVAFFSIGLYVGTRVVAAPILHGAGMGIFSLLAWLVVNIFVGEPMGATTWRSLDAGTTIGLLMLQAAAAIVGVRMGVRWMRKGPAEGQTVSSGG